MSITTEQAEGLFGILRDVLGNRAQEAFNIRRNTYYHRRHLEFGNTSPYKDYHEDVDELDIRLVDCGRPEDTTVIVRGYEDRCGDREEKWFKLNDLLDNWEDYKADLLEKRGAVAEKFLQREAERKAAEERRELEQFARLQEKYGEVR